MKKQERPKVKACFLGLVIISMSILSPMEKRKKMRPNFAKVSSTRCPFMGKNVARNPTWCPNSDGPNTIPL